jgi:hypothetical protein
MALSASASVLPVPRSPFRGSVWQAQPRWRAGDGAADDDESFEFGGAIAPVVAVVAVAVVPVVVVVEVAVASSGVGWGPNIHGSSSGSA